MRAYRLRSTLLPLCAALILPIAACGDDSTPGSDTTNPTDTTDTVQPDTTDTVQPDTTDTTQPDTSDTTQPDTSDTTQPDTTDTAQPDTSDTTQPDTTDTTQPDTTDTADPDTTDTADPDTTDTADPDTTDTAQPDTTDTAEPDTTPTTLATLLAPFAGSANNFETTPGATVAGLVVTLVKPNVGDELGGFFAVDPSDMTPVFFAPAAGAAGVPAAGSTVTVKVDTIKNVAGVPMVTAFSNLSVTSTGADLDALATNIDAWTAAEYADSQSSYIDLTGTISGPSVPAGGGVSNGYHRFGFTSDGLTAVSNAVQVRMPLALINTLAIEDGCIFSITGGAVWGFRGSAVDATIQYQPMVVDSANLTVLCDAPTLTGATTDGDTSVVLTFSRPLDPTTVEAAAFTFDPTLTVNAATLSANGKTVTLTTAAHAAASYTVTVDETVTDILGEPIDPNADTFTFDTGAVQPEVGVLYCFETSAGTFIATPTVVGTGFANALGVTKGLATTPGSAGGNANTAAQNAPSACTGASQAPNSNAWSTAATFSAASAEYYSVKFDAPAGRLAVRFDTRRSGTGPTQFALWTSIGNTVIAQDVVIGADSVFGVHPQWPPAGTDYAFDVPTPSPVELRIFGYGASATSGTFRIDNLTVLYTPVD